MKIPTTVVGSTSTAGTGSLSVIFTGGAGALSTSFKLYSRIPYSLQNGANWEWGLGTCLPGNVFERTQVNSKLVSGTLTQGGTSAIALSGTTQITLQVTEANWDGFAQETDLATALAAIGIYSELTVASMGGPGAGMGICKPDYVPAGLVGLSGYTDKMHANFGNYIHPASGSIMGFIPRYWYKWGTGSNGLAVNQLSIVQHEPALQDFLIADGYAVDRMFWDGGAIKSGVFVDKYLCSNNGGLAASILNGNPLSVNASHNPISGLTGAFPNAQYSAIDAAKARGTGFFCSSRFIYAGLARLSYAHGQQSGNSTYCAWYDATHNFPKGCNNNALRDAQDGTVIYTTDGFANCAKTGSGTPFAKTTHNGQACGIADLNGLMWEVTPGLTSNGTNFYALKTSVAMASLTSGTTLATDLFGATGIAANYDSFGTTYAALTASSTTKSFGNAAQVFGEQASGLAWTATGLGIPLAGGVGGTNAFGNDSLLDYRNSDALPTSGGYWASSSAAGIWALNAYDTRALSANSVGFRAAIYPTA